MNVEGGARLREGEEFWDSKKERVLVILEAHTKFVRAEDPKGDVLEIRLSPKTFIEDGRFTRLADPEYR